MCNDVIWYTKFTWIKEILTIILYSYRFFLTVIGIGFHNIRFYFYIVFKAINWLFYFSPRDDKWAEKINSSLKNLTRVNESLQIMSNYATIRGIESWKKVVEFESVTMEIMRMQMIFYSRRSNFWKLIYPYLIIQKEIHLELY